MSIVECRRPLIQAGYQKSILAGYDALVLQLDWRELPCHDELSVAPCESLPGLGLLETAKCLVNIYFPNIFFRDHGNDRRGISSGCG